MTTSSRRASSGHGLRRSTRARKPPKAFEPDAPEPEPEPGKRKAAKRRRRSTNGSGGGERGGGNGGADDKSTLNFEDYLLPPDSMLDMESVGGMETEKEMIYKNFVQPMKFSGALRTSRGMLMYGPPGTGKTFITKAIPTSVNEMFGRAEGTDLIVVKSSALYSDLFGKTEKNIAGLFEWSNQRILNATVESPVVIVFIDEVDALTADRAKIRDPSSGATSVTNSMLMELDGAARNASGMFHVGTTNTPWAMDPAALRRFPVKVFVDLPDDEARRSVVQAALLSRMGRREMRRIRDGALGDLSAADSKWSRIVDVLTEVTAWKDEAVHVLYKELTRGERAMDENDVRAFFMRYNRCRVVGGRMRVPKSNPGAVHLLGFSPSDISAFVLAGVNEVAYAKLYDTTYECGGGRRGRVLKRPPGWVDKVQTASKYDMFIDGRDDRGEAIDGIADDSAPVCTLSVEESSEIRVTAEDLDRYFGAMAVALDEFRPSTTVETYLKYVRYAINEA